MRKSSTALKEDDLGMDSMPGEAVADADSARACHCMQLPISPEASVKVELFQSAKKVV